MCTALWHKYFFVLLFFTYTWASSQNWWQMGFEPLISRLLGPEVKASNHLCFFYPGRPPWRDTKSGSTAWRPGSRPGCVIRYTPIFIASSDLRGLGLSYSDPTSFYFARSYLNSCNLSIKATLRYRDGLEPLNCSEQTKQKLNNCFFQYFKFLACVRG